MTLADLIEDWQGASDRGIKRHLTLTEDGLLLGADTVIAKRRNDDEMACEIDGREDEILALLGTAYGRPVSPDIISHLQRGDEAYRNGDLVTAEMHLAFSGLRGLGDEESAAFRLFLADRLLQSGLGAEDLLTALSDDAAPTDPLRKARVDDQKHPGYPAGTPGGKGGQFRPKDGTEPVIPEEWKERTARAVARRVSRELAVSLVRIVAGAALNLVPGIGEVAGVATIIGELLTRAAQNRALEIDAQAVIDFAKTGPHTLEELQAAAYGPSQPGYENHHIVTQGGKNAGNIPTQLLHSPDNIVRVPTLLHEEINAAYSRSSKEASGMTVYQWLQTQPYEVQREEGIKIMRKLDLIQ